jgi:uncharacterized protein YyaL (SSP411 family)
MKALMENVTVTMPEGAKLPSRDCIHQSFRQLHERFDAEYGGFGKAPKFPQPSKAMKCYIYLRKLEEFEKYSILSTCHETYTQ